MKSDEKDRKIKNNQNNNKKTIITNKQTIIKTTTNLSIKDNDSKQRKETNLNTSWNTIVDTTPQPNIPNQIITSDHSSLSSLTVNTTEQKKRKKKR